MNIIQEIIECVLYNYKGDKISKYSNVDGYIKDQPEWQGKIITQLRKILKNTAPNAKETIKWAQPVYEDENGPFCFMKAHKNHVNIGFWRGAAMNDPTNVLEGYGVKMRHIKIYQETNINENVISDFIKQALDLNDKLGDPSK